jgi:hypothetical protein
MLRSSTYLLAGGLIELLMAWHNGSLDVPVDRLLDHATLLTVGTSRAAGALARRAGSDDGSAEPDPAPGVPQVEVDREGA